MCGAVRNEVADFCAGQSCSGTGVPQRTGLKQALAGSARDRLIHTDFHPTHPPHYDYPTTDVTTGDRGFSRVVILQLPAVRALWG